MIEFQNVCFHYGTKTILDQINLAVPEGEFLCLLGQSGCGKSTLLRLAVGLALPESGEIVIGTTPTLGPDRRCAVVFQDYSLFPWMSTGENLILALRCAFPQKGRAELRTLAESYLELVGLGNCFGKFPGMLSGGMRQRAAIARALSVDSPILLLDEPFGALDPMNRTILQELLLTLWQDSARKRTAIFVTHDIDEAISLGTRIVMLGSLPGRIIADKPVPRSCTGSRQALLETEAVKTFREELLSLYRQDTQRKIEARFLVTESGGI